MFDKKLCLLCFFLLFSNWLEVSEAEEPVSKLTQTEWGEIKPVANHPGEFELIVNRWPESGELPLLEGTQVVLCETVEKSPQPIEIKVDPQTGRNFLVLPHGSEPGQEKNTEPLLRLSAFVANETGQVDDGKWFLTAQQATVQGDRAKLESQPGNHRIGFWTNAEDSVQWKFKATRWGMYRVILTYANASPAGSKVTLKIGEENLQAQLISTGSWYRYTSLDLGKVYLPQTGDQLVKVQCSKLVGSAVMNLKAITLLPDFEGPLPVQADDGSITLYCGSAKINGTTLRYEPAEQKRTIGYWVKKESATWRFTVKQPGTFEVEVLQGCGKGQGGSEMLLLLGDQLVSFTVEDTGHFQNFKARRVGRIKIEEPGEYELTARPAKIAKAAACDIRQIRLLPVEDQE